MPIIDNQKMYELLAKGSTNYVNETHYFSEQEILSSWYELSESAQVRAVFYGGLYGRDSGRYPLKAPLYRFLGDRADDQDIQVRPLLGNYILDFSDDGFDLKLVLTTSGSIALYFKGSRRLMTDDVEVLQNVIVDFSPIVEVKDA